MIDHDPGLVEQVKETIAREGVEFINLTFTDIAGMVKNLTIPVNHWGNAVANGVWFDGSSIEGFARIAESDMRLFPDLNTFKVIPWEADGLVTARVICDVRTTEGDPFAGDPRAVLKRAVAAANELGLGYYTGPELEFFLFKVHPDGGLLPLAPHDDAGYFDVTTDLAHQVRRTMVKNLQQLGINVEAAHHEVATGQHEIDFRYDDAVSTADNAVTLRVAVKAVAQQFGLYATFMPKPIMGINGSGMHTHQSLYDLQTGANLFADASDAYGLSDLARQFVAGQLKHARAMSAVIAPLVNSYKRLVPGYEAPVYISWARTNRSALIRIPKVEPERIHVAARVELRCPDPSANPYLAFAVMLWAGLDGIKHRLSPPVPREEDLYHLDQATAGLETMPGSLAEAVAELEQSDLLRQALGEHIFDRFVEAKRQEWDEYRLYVSGWETRRYLPVY